jgi:3-deoxy-D-manno-octulosonate 8-phosphate phosphatase (KDO 8-P phosphatase)
MMDKQDHYLGLMSNISTFFFDVDGVLTDGSVILNSDGEQMRTMNVKDGYALQYAIKQGFCICIISGGSNPMVKERLEGLGVRDVYLGVENKLSTLTKFLSDHQIDATNALYMGDDIPDFQVMQACGIAVCPNDAVQEIKEASDYISSKDGGKGAVRDVIEKVLRLQGKWFKPNSDFSNYTW